jgi:MFS superfamily sulfate permease-like transporter
MRASSPYSLFALFPQSIIGAMLLLVGVQLTGFVRDIRKNELIMMALTAGLSLVTNMAIGFVVALIAYHTLMKLKVVSRYLE